MQLLNTLMDGDIVKLELLAEQEGVVMWACTPDYKKSLFISSNYHNIWKRNITDVYKDLAVWRSFLIPEQQGDTFNMIIKRNTQINPKHTELYSIFLPDNTKQWIIDRAFNVVDVNGKAIMTAGVAAPVTELELEGKAYQATSDRLDKCALRYYFALVGNHQNINANSVFYKKFSDLTKREKEILAQILYGLTGEQIAKKLCISNRTVETHTNAIKDKFECDSKSEVISKAIEANCIFVFLPDA